MREAVSAYAARHRPKVKPRSLGLARSGRGDLSERAEELLRGGARSGFPRHHEAGETPALVTSLPPRRQRRL